MLFLLLIFIVVALWLWALFECLTTPAEQVRTLPKLGWLAIIVLLTGTGAALWFWLGRPRDRQPAKSWPALQPTPRAERVTRTDHAPIGPDDDPEFLSNL